MATIAAIRCRDGVAIAGDRIRTRDGRVESRNRQHVLDLLPTVGAAAVGRDVGRFSDRLAGELRSYLFERDRVSLDALERIASDVAADAGVEAIVVTHDGAGRAGLRALTPDGSSLSDAPVAFGSGTALVLGSLEAADTRELATADAEPFLRDVFVSAAERDPGTGDAVDVWTLADA